MNLSELLDRIELKMQRLVRKTQMLENELAALAAENERLREEIAQKEIFVAVLKDALASTKPVDDTRLQDIRETRDVRFAREMDNSIDWLNTKRP